MLMTLFQGVWPGAPKAARILKNGRRRPGFSLIEMVVVIGLMGILLTLLVMANDRLNSTYQLRSDMRQLAAAAKQATQLARSTLAKTRVLVFKEDNVFAMQIEKQIIDQNGNDSWSCHSGSYHRFYHKVEVSFVKSSESYTVNTKSCGNGQQVTGATAVDMLPSARGVQFAEVEMTAPGNPVWVINASGVKIALKN